jgi:Xaa-Pro dipeptidase
VPAKKGLADRILDFLGAATKIGVEPAMPQEISARLGGARLKVLPLLEDMRLVKSPAEVEMVRQAARYADMCVANVARTAYYGVSNLELFAQARPVQMQVMKDGEYELLTTSLLTGAWPAPLSAQPHGVPHLGDRLREGPHIALALIRVNGYGAECERTFFTAPPDNALRQAFADMTEARNLSFKLVRPGASCAEIDAAGNGYLRDRGYGDRLLHRVGHGFGLNNHEGPWLSGGSTDVLAENMIISIEPGIYLPGVGGVRHSDTVLVTRDGYEVLNRYPTDIDTAIVKGYKAGKRLQGWIMRKAVGIK